MKNRGFTPAPIALSDFAKLRLVRGFTLVEILVASAIFSILLLAVFMVMDAGRTSWLTGDALVELRQEVVKAFTIMEQEMKEIRPGDLGLAIGASSNSLTFRVTQDNDADGTVLDSLANIEWSGNIVYSLNGASQIIRTAGGASSILANNIIVLQFSRPVGSTNLLQVDITAQKMTGNRRLVQDTGQIVIKMRN